MQQRSLLHRVEVPPLAGTVPFRHGSALWVPPSEGVYLLHDLRGVLYVGRSDQLRRRYYEHLEAEYNELIIAALRWPSGVPQFSWITSSASRRIEKQLVRGFQPPCNRVKYNKIRV